MKIRLIWRSARFFFQRLIWGFSVGDLWDLYVHLSDLIVKRLRRFAQYCNSGLPRDMEPEEWRAILDKMIYAFEQCVDGEPYAEERQARVNEGLDLFRKYFFDLWD